MWRVLAWAVAGLVLSGCGSASIAPLSLPPTLTPDCRNAVAVLQAYRVPGQAEPLGRHLENRLAAEARMRPVGGGTWKTYRLGSGCAVYYDVSISNTPQALHWDVDADGTARTADALTQRLSGW